jgi:hypothetical protein
MRPNQRKVGDSMMMMNKSSENRVLCLEKLQKLHPILIYIKFFLKFVCKIVNGVASVAFRGEKCPIC